MKKFTVILLITLLYPRTNFSQDELIKSQIKGDNVSLQDSNVTMLGIYTSGDCGDVFVNGNHAYIIKQPTIEILDLTNSVSPKPVGYLVLDTYVYKVLVSGNYAYAMGEYRDEEGYEFNGFYIINIQDPAHPFKVGVYKFEQEVLILSVKISGDNLYVINREYRINEGKWFISLSILDIKDSYNIKEIGRSDIYPQCWGYDLCISDNYAYFSTDTQCIYKFDVSDPEHPFLAGTYYIDGEVISIYGNRAYLLNKQPELLIVDLIDSSKYEIIGTYILKDSNYFYSVKDLHISDDYAYICCTLMESASDFRKLGLVVLDLTDPENPVEIGSFVKPLRGYWVEGMSICQNYACIAAGPDGLNIIDISDPYNPEEVYYYHTGGGVGPFTVDGHYTYFDNGQFGGLSIIDNSEPENLQWVNFFDTQLTASQIIASGDYLYLIGASIDRSSRHLSVIDMTNPEIPQQISLLDLGDRAPVSFQIDGNYAFILLGYGELCIYDIIDPMQIEEVSTTQTGGWGNKILIYNDFAYIGGSYGGWGTWAVLKVFDVHDPLNPIFIDSLIVGGGAFTQVGILNNFLYVTGSWHDPVEGIIRGQWFHVLDISDPSNISCVDTLDLEVNDFCLFKNNLYLTTEYGLEIYNAKNPFNLQRIGSYALKNLDRILVNSDMIYVSGSGVLYTFKMGSSTEIVENSRKITSYTLKQNYPNPFNPSTTIEFTIPESEFTTLKVYNILGKEIANLVSAKLQQGNHTYTFDGSNLASGIYYYAIQAGGLNQVRKMVLLK